MLLVMLFTKYYMEINKLFFIAFMNLFKHLKKYIESCVYLLPLTFAADQDYVVGNKCVRKLEKTCPNNGRGKY